MLFAIAYVCKIFNIEFKSFKWVSDDGNVDTWEENVVIGFENFKKVLDNLDI